MPADLTIKQKDIRTKITQSTGKIQLGIGATISCSQGKKTGTFDLKLNQSINEFVNRFGEPEKIRKVGDSLNKYDYSECGLIVDVSNDHSVVGMQVSKTGYQVDILKTLIEIGDPVSKVLNLLGSTRGFEPVTMNLGNIKERLVYKELGIAFGITYQGKIGFIYIW